MTVTLSASEAAAGFDLYCVGRAGPVGLRRRSRTTPRQALRVALAELAANARAGRVAHPCDVRFGRDVGHVLSERAAACSTPPASADHDHLPLPHTEAADR